MTTAMNTYPVLLEVSPKDTSDRTYGYLIEKGQISKEWMDLLDSLKTPNEGETDDFLKTAIVACVEHFTSNVGGFCHWARVGREEYANRTQTYRDIAEVINFEAGCQLMDDWIQLEFKGMWKAKTDDTPIQVNEPVILIRHRTH